MNDDPVSDCDTFTDNNIGMYDAVLPDLGLFPYKNSWQDDRAITDGNVVRQKCKGVYRDAFANWTRLEITASSLMPGWKTGQDKNINCLCKGKMGIDANNWEVFEVGYRPL